MIKASHTMCEIQRSLWLYYRINVSQKLLTIVIRILLHFYVAKHIDDDVPGSASKFLLRKKI